MRWGLKLLLGQQKILKDAIDKLVMARSSADYRDIIATVRGALDPIHNNRDRFRDLIIRAIKNLGIVKSETTPDAVDIASEEIAASIVSNPAIANKFHDKTKFVGPNVALYNFSSRMSVAHTTTLRMKLPYIPHPERRDAEYALYMAIIYFNHLIRLLRDLELKT